MSLVSSYHIAKIFCFSIFTLNNYLNPQSHKILLVVVKMSEILCYQRLR